VGDFDQNQRVVILVTKEVNKATTPPLGFVSHANLLATTQCAGSNEGEFFFMRSPDPAGTLPAGSYPVSELVGDINSLLIHEFAHNIQGSRRLAAGGQFMVSWLAEGLATAAQEMAGFSLTGRSDGNNYGRTVAYTTLGGDPRDFFNYVSDLIAYFGYNFAAGHVPGAPEQCTWVGNAAAGNPGPCSFSIRLLYGVPWSLIKYHIDRRLGGPANQKTITRQFSNLVSQPGFPELETVLGQPIAILMAEWAPTLWIDDRYLAAADYQLKNWNLRDLVGAWQSANAELLPRIRGFTDFADEFTIRGGSTAFFEVSGGNRPATALRVRETGGGAAPQIVTAWVVRVHRGRIGRCSAIRLIRLIRLIRRVRPTRLRVPTTYSRPLSPSATARPKVSMTPMARAAIAGGPIVSPSGSRPHRVRCCTPTSAFADSAPARSARASSTRRWQCAPTW
jgi:hypothetical protein